MTAFALPYFFNLFTSDVKYALVGIVNLYLISAIFSMMMLYRANIWGVCGLHSIWNFLLYGVFGLTLSGNVAASEGIICFTVDQYSIINGGTYGIESSVITMFILALAVFVLYKHGKKKGGAAIAKSWEEITLLDIYRAVECVEHQELFHFHENPNVKCPVGKNIHQILDGRLTKAQEALEKELASTTLSQVIQDADHYIKE